MPQKYYYKVVQKTEDPKVFISAIISPSSRKFSLKYKMGRWTRPNIGKIFVFDSRKAAVEFTSGDKHYSVLRCVVKNPQKGGYRKIDYWDRKGINSFWKGDEEKRRMYGYINISGTVLADAIRIIK